MSSRPTPDAAAESELTLGKLLYGDGSKSRVAESAWVSMVGAIAARDVRAMQTLYAQLHGFVFTIALRITCSRWLAEEIVVDVFHDVWKRADRYSPSDGTVVGWVMNVARSRAIDRLRYETRKKRVATGGIVEVVAAPEPDLLEQRQQMALVKGAIAGLNDEERTAIELAYFSETSYSEVARRLEVPLGTIKSRIRSALAKLRVALGDERDS